MGSTARKVIGAIFGVAGFALLILAIFSTFIFAIYGVGLLIIGVTIFFNKGEDRIEERKDLNKSKGKKS